MEIHFLSKKTLADPVTTEKHDETSAVFGVPGRDDAGVRLLTVKYPEKDERGNAVSGNVISSDRKDSTASLDDNYTMVASGSEDATAAYILKVMSARLKLKV